MLKRGYCCKSGCRHCPYGFSKSPKESDRTKNENRNEQTDDTHP
ncbi:MAG TPA: DUF5522 domain-containing protein [Chryseosolibacter sp.]|nr:DUF5522 domain-containing protein [Chryseosolibacter sp.]